MSQLAAGEMGYKANSNPCISDGFGIYYPDNENKLMRIGLDGTNYGQVFSSKTQYTPVTDNKFLYFNENNSLYKCSFDLPEEDQLQKEETWLPPFVHTDGHVYYQQNSTKYLMRVCLNNLAAPEKVGGGVTTDSSPVISGDFIYFSVNGKIKKMKTDAVYPFRSSYDSFTSQSITTFCL